MADRTSAEIFGNLFDYLANKPLTDEVKKDAEVFWGWQRGYDFTPDQMGADESLAKLGLTSECPKCTWTLYKGMEDYHEEDDCLDMQECLKERS